MRRRLIFTFVALVVTVVLLYGVPRAFILSQSVRDNEEELVARGADTSAALVQDALRDGEDVTPAQLEPVLRGGERVEFRGADGTGFVVPAGTSRGEDDLVATRTLDGGATLTYSLARSAVDEQVVQAVTPLVLLGLGLIPIGVLAGALLARRLSRPFSELAAAARTMGTGDLGADVPHYDVPEAEEIATALRESSRRLAMMLERERDVAVNASHELRTPITALRLALEDLSMWPETSPDVTAELSRLVGEVDRLADAVTTMLDARRRWSRPEGT
jgi:signal transduction histidine kinase